MEPSTVAPDNGSTLSRPGGALNAPRNTLQAYKQRGIAFADTLMRLAAPLLLAVMLPGCGSGESPTSDPNAASAKPGFINSFSLRATGAIDTNRKYSGSELGSSGHCDGSRPIAMGFRNGAPHEPDFFSFRFETDQAVPTGATGGYAATKIVWTNGSIEQKTADGRTVAVPHLLRGAGTLELTLHRATSGGRRLAGTVQGTLRDRYSSEPAEVTAEFDINLTCGLGF